MVSVATPAKQRITRPTSTRRPRSTARKVGSWLFFAVALLVTLVWLFPFMLVLLTSLHTTGNLGPNLLAWFKDLTLANYPRAWEQAGLSRYLINSAIVTFIKVPLGLIVSGTCAFGISRFRYRFRTSIIVVIIGLAAIPIQIGLISIFRMELDAGLLNTYFGLIVVYLAFGVPFQTVFMVAYFNQIPLEIEESARLDGAGPWRYLATIVFPLAKPLLAALFVLDFVATWNEFPIALTLLQTSTLWTSPLGLLSFQGTFSNDYSLLSAAIVILAIPVLIVYVSMQRFFVSGLTAGAVKG